jgi:hypothetical protein
MIIDMKRKNLIMFILMTAIAVYYTEAQDKIVLVNPEQYLFEEFSRGKVGLKTGRDLNVMLNYNIVTERLVFQQKGQIYDMTDFTEVDTVFLNNRKFIPAGKGFFEIADAGKYTLLLQYIGKIQDPPRPAAYGGTSDVSSSTYMNNVKFGNEVYRLQNDTTLNIKREIIYWLKTGDKTTSFASEKQLTKLLPQFKTQIKVFINDNRIKFNDPRKVTDLINYCNTL